jgi:hypothetical protein
MPRTSSTGNSSFTTETVEATEGFPVFAYREIPIGENILLHHQEQREFSPFDLECYEELPTGFTADLFICRYLPANENAFLCALCDSVVRSKRQGEGIGVGASFHHNAERRKMMGAADGFLEIVHSCHDLAVDLQDHVP